MKPIYFAIKFHNGRYWTRTGSPTPALFTTVVKAKLTVEQNGPGLIEDGYDIVQFTEL